MRELRCSRPAEARAGQRRRRPRQHERVDRARSARGRRGERCPGATARCAADRRAAIGRVGDVSGCRDAGSGTGVNSSGKRGARVQTVSAGSSPILTGVSARKGGHARTVLPEKCPVLTGVSGSKGGQDQPLFELGTVESPAQTPAKTPAETPAANVRAGREPLNPRIREDPPNPPEGGSSRDSILVEETYVTARGRTRRREVRIDLDEVRRSRASPRTAASLSPTARSSDSSAERRRDERPRTSRAARR